MPQPTPETKHTQTHVQIQTHKGRLVVCTHTPLLNKKNTQTRTTEYALEGLMLKLKRQYFGHVMRRANSLEKTVRLGKIVGKSKRG